MQRGKRGFFLTALSAVSLVACAGSQTAPVTAAEEDDSSLPSESAPEIPERVRADVLGPAPSAVPALPASCPEGRPLPEAHSCTDSLEQLARAVASDDAARDAALNELESCREFPVGFVRALRAELAATECGDALAAPLTHEAASHVSGTWRETLVGLGLAARLRRIGTTPPEEPSSREKAELEEYFKAELFPWIASQASAIQELSSQGAQLSGYARGVVAIEAGMADMRFVELARRVPIPRDMEADAELREVYYASLDEALEPRKTRGRDAALVGLRALAQVGVYEAPRLTQARALLSRVFGGSRVTALDELLLPAAPRAVPNDAEHRLAAELPTPYSAQVLAHLEPEPDLVLALSARGLPTGLAKQLESSEEPRSLWLAGRARLLNGVRYFRREDFQTAHTLLTYALDPKRSTTAPLENAERQDARLLRALAVALSAGPVDAADLLARGPRFAESLGNLAELDALALESGVHAGRAAYNAAYLRELIAAPNSPEIWRDLSARYKRAASLLRGEEQKKAQSRASAAAATEKAIRATMK